MQKIMFAAMHSGSGKTLITYSFIQYLTDMGHTVQSFKTGPDYIDTMYHTLISQRACINLDPFFLKEKDRIKEVFLHYQRDASICIIEAAMGYYDGIYGMEPKASAYTVANAIEAEVILVLDFSDIKDYSLGVSGLEEKQVKYEKKSLEEIANYIHRYDNVQANRIQYLILNGIDEERFSCCRDEIEEKLGLKIILHLPFQKEFRMPSRHLGLHIPDMGLLEKACTMRTLIQKYIDKDFAMNLQKDRYCLGVAKDEAFSFLYEENLRLLRKSGAKIVYFSPLKDHHLPKGLDGLYLPGGYPELYAKELSQNTDMRSEILAFVKERPFMAECGGFLYLHRELVGMDGISYSMVGLVDAKAYKKDKLTRFGYVYLHAKEDSLLFKRGERLAVHEFHYFESEKDGEDFYIEKANGSNAWDTGYAGEDFYMGFPHLYLSEIHTKRFAKQCIKKKNLSINKI